MSLLKVIVFLLIISIAVVDSRARRKRRQASQPSSYLGTYGLGYNTQNGGYPLYELGINGYPVGNNWYMSNNQGYQNSNQSPYNLQQYPDASNYGYSSWTGNPGNDQSGQHYTGQSYVPSTNDWLPLPGADRRKRSFESILISKMSNNLAVSKDK